jgi:hypothetical protein
MSDNPLGADNQQESLSPRLNRGSQNPQRPYAGSPARRLENDMVRAAWRHAVVSGTETTHPFLQNVTRLSEIPCRVSSDLHEWRNDLAAVSARDPVKL